MNFKTHLIDPPLDKYLESIFHYSGYIPDHSIERVVPTGHIFIIFELDNFTRTVFNNSTLEPRQNYTKVWISGMHRNYISISAHQKSEMFVIQFKPFGAYPFFKVLLKEINEQIIPAQNIFGVEILNLRKQILDLQIIEDKFRIAEKWLLSIFDNSRIPPDDFLNLIEKLQNGSVAKFNEIIEAYSNTHKHLIDQFKKYVGLTPKYFQRILRFNEILVEVQKQNKIQWSQIAYQCGYSDQSHFIKDFKHFSGFNPQDFIKQDYDQDQSNFFRIDY